MESLKCTICIEFFNGDDKRPLILPCGKFNIFYNLRSHLLQKMFVRHVKKRKIKFMSNMLRRT